MRIEKVFPVIIACLIAGCTTERVAARLAFPLVQGQYDAIQDESDVVLAERAIPASLKRMEGLLKEDPENVELLLRLSEGFCGYAFSFLEDTEPARAAAAYSRGRGYASRALRADAGGMDLEALNLDEFDGGLAALGKDHLPALFWLGQCWAGWLNLSLDNPLAFADISRLQKLIGRLLEIGPGYHHGGPHLLAGAFYGGRSRVLGGDPEKARSHFEESLRLTEGNYLVARYLYAKTLAVQTQDRSLFEQQLKTVEAAAADGLPGQRLANEVAKVRSKLLLESADDLF